LWIFVQILFALFCKAQLKNHREIARSFVKTRSRQNSVTIGNNTTCDIPRNLGLVKQNKIDFAFSRWLMTRRKTIFSQKIAKVTEGQKRV
jgi:hypothetical protein